MALVRVPFYFINLLPTSLLYISILLLTLFLVFLFSLSLSFFLSCTLALALASGHAVTHSLSLTLARSLRAQAVDMAGVLQGSTYHVLDVIEVCMSVHWFISLPTANPRTVFSIRIRLVMCFM